MEGTDRKTANSDSARRDFRDVQARGYEQYQGILGEGSVSRTVRADEHRARRVGENRYWSPGARGVLGGTGGPSLAAALGLPPREPHAGRERPDLPVGVARARRAEERVRPVLRPLWAVN